MTYNQDPTEHLDYQWDLAENELAVGEAIESVSHAETAGITVDQVSELNGVITYWVSGGTAGERYRVTLHATTSQGREYERTSVFQIIDR